MEDTMKQALIRAMALLITIAMLLAFVPVVAIAKTPVVVLSTSTTSIVLADVYERIIPVGELLMRRYQRGHYKQLIKSRLSQKCLCRRYMSVVDGGIGATVYSKL